jgi:hypothetical protein
VPLRPQREPQQEGENQGELTPVPEAGVSGRSARAGRALLRFLIGDGG